MPGETGSPPLRADMSIASQPSLRISLAVPGFADPVFFSNSCGFTFLKLSRNYWLTSLFQVFLIYWLILPGWVLFY